MNISKSERQAIIREFAVRHNGTYNPSLFFEEVANIGNSHPAHSWFEWDKDEAARAHNIERARDFARGLKVTFEIKEVGRKTPVKVKTVEAPMVISPLEGRNDGGGYVLVNPKDDSHLKELCLQAAKDLRAWLHRYGSALEYAGRRKVDIEKVVLTLDNAKSIKENAA